MQEIPEPLDVSWPNTARKRITFVMLAPIIIPLWLTLPDVRRPVRPPFPLSPYNQFLIAFNSFDRRNKNGSLLPSLAR